jgi:hypothetical protein
MYKEIYQKAKAYEQETVRFLMDMVRIPAFSTKEKDVIECIKKKWKPQVLMKCLWILSAT